jgi:hypothetical protein
MILQILTGIALVAAVPPAGPATKPQAVPAAASAPEPVVQPSADALRVADWIAASRDNHALPYAVIDKHAASLILFDGAGKLVSQVPVLLGSAAGDDATPGVGSKKLGEIGPAEKTTPAGRFLAKFGYAAGRQRVLWVDYTNSVAIHPIPGDAARSENRRARMLSPEVDDNRITFGCINVPHSFYATDLRPLFQKKGGYVYVLPDTRSLEDVFPRLRVHALTSGRDAA